MATVTFVIGANASGKTTFIQNHFLDKNVVILNIYDYQQQAYEDNFEGFKSLYKANENLLTDLIDILQQGKNVVVEHTLFKAKRRITYIDNIRRTLENINIEVFIMCPADDLWKSYIAKRNLNGSFQSHKKVADEIEFPNPCEGFDRIYEVVDNKIQLRMEAPKPEILDIARKELLEESERFRKEEERKQTVKRILLDTMNYRPFLHICEVCGQRSYITAQEAFDEGWDYPPQMGTFGVLGPRTCGSRNCSITSTLYWKVQQQELPIVLEETLTSEELQTWRRIKNEPESLLVLEDMNK